MLFPVLPATPATPPASNEELLVDWIERHNDRFAFHELLTECRIETGAIAATTEEGILDNLQRRFGTSKRPNSPEKAEAAARDSFRLHIPRHVLKALLCCPKDAVWEAGMHALVGSVRWDLICECLAEKWTAAICAAMSQFQLAAEAEAIRLELAARDAERLEGDAFPSPCLSLALV